MENRKQILLRIIACVLLIPLLVGLVPPASVAAEPQKAYEGSIHDTQMAIQGTNSFGTLLEEEIGGELEEEQESDATYNVTALVIEGSTAQITLDTLEEAELVVAIYTEDGTQMLQSVKTTVEANATGATVTFTEELPEYFLAAAYLLDTFDMSPLCAPYETPRYTQDMQELLASDIHDYDPELVLNLDESEDNNFAVYEEGVKLISEQEGVNVVVSADDENSIYVIENADERITSLIAGDILAYDYGDEGLIIAKVASIQVDGTTVTIQGGELDMEEVFSHVKILGDMNNEGAQVDPSTADEGITYLGKKENGTNRMPGDIAPQWTESASISDTFGVQYSLDENLSLSGELSFTAEGVLEFCVTPKRQHVEVTLELDVSFTFSVTVKVKETIKKNLGKVILPIVTGVDLTFTPKLVFEISASISGTVGMSTQIGFSFDHKSKKKAKFKNLSRKPKGTFTFKYEGTLFFGLELETALEVGAGKLAEVGVSGTAGLEFSATLVEAVYGDGLSHECIGCVSGKAYVKLSAGVELKFLKRKKLTFSRTLTVTRCRAPKLDFYICAMHADAGLGECPYILHQLTVTVKDEDGNPVEGVSVHTDGQSEIGDVELTNKNGVAVLHLQEGKHNIQAVTTELYGKKKVTVGDKNKVTITVKPYESEEDEDGALDDANSGDFIDNGAVLHTGTCGENLTWKLYESGLLRIEGTGAMFDYERPVADAPWYEYREQITRLEVKEGVTSLGDYAFFGHTNLFTAELPNELQRIGHRAFSSCNSLHEINFPETLRRIETYAFIGCYGLGSIELPSSLTYMGDCVFQACYGLHSAVLSDGLSYVPEGIFNACSNLTSVTIPDGVESIDDAAFWECRNLRSVTIPDSVTRIGYKAFYSTDLSSITIPNSVTHIENDAFAYTPLQRVDIPASVTELENAVFRGCGALQGIYVDKFNPNYSSDAYGALFNKDKTVLLETPGQIGTSCVDNTYIIPNSVVEIGSGAFAHNCDWMDQVVIPASVKKIHGYAFYDTFGLKSIKFCGDAPYFGPHALSEDETDGIDCDTCYIYYPAGNETWTAEVMNRPGRDLVWRSYDTGNESLLASGTHGDNLTWKLNDLGVLTISGTGEMAGYDTAGIPWMDHRHSVHSVVIEEGVTSIGQYAFWDCSSMTSAIIPNSVVHIADNAFRDCTALVDLKIPDSVTTIETEAFWNSGLKSVEISANVTRIGNYAFGEGRSMTGIHVDENNPNYSSDASGVLFDKAQTILLQAPCAIAGAYTVPDTVTEIGSQAFMWCSGLTEITFPVSVTTIGHIAFYDCTGLTDVYYGGTRDQWDAIAMGQYNECLSDAVIHCADGESGALIQGMVETIGRGPDALMPNAVYPGDYGYEETENGTVKTAAFEGLVADAEYVLLVMVGVEAEDPLSPENLLYIDHAAATGEGTIDFTYVPRIWMEECYVVLCGPSHRDLNDAEITFPLMSADEDTQAVNPTVVYEGETLVEEQDYVLLGQVSFTENGTYTCYIRGVRNYTGLVKCTYSVADHDHEFETYTSNGDATCTADGTKTAKCIHCDVTHTLPDVGSKLPHSWDEGTVTKEPTEDSSGECLYTCTVCGETRTELFDHEYVLVEVIAPTCTDEGYSLYRCSVCGHERRDDQVDATGHSFGEWVLIREPEGSEPGLEKRTCASCGRTEQRNVLSNGTSFVDVEPDSFYHEPVLWALEYGITTGVDDEHFGPTMDCVRAQVVTFLWRAAGCPDPNNTYNPFVDVQPTDFFYKPVLWAVENNITTGLDATHFGSHSPCNRAQVVTFLYRTMGCPGVWTTESPFVDVNPTDFYYSPVLWALENGVTTGLDASHFGANSPCNRAQVVTFLYRTFMG